MRTCIMVEACMASNIRGIHFQCMKVHARFGLSFDFLEEIIVGAIEIIVGAIAIIVGAIAIIVGAIAIVIGARPITIGAIAIIVGGITAAAREARRWRSHHRGMRLR